MQTVVIVGGGITGLTTLHYLQQMKRKHNLQLELILLEKNQYLGGKINTVKRDEYIIETGADSIVARHESVLPLIRDLQLEDEVVYNETGISYIYTNNHLHPIPSDTVFGIPASIESLYSSTLVSEEGKKAALMDLETKNNSFTKDNSIGEFLRCFLGHELVEKQIAPVLSGVYSGNLDELTIASTLPYLLDYKNQYGSIIKGLGENKEKFLSANNKKFISFNTGLSTIINRLEESVTEDALILKGIHPHKIYRENNKYEIICSDDNKIYADHVVLATPHQVSEKLLNNTELHKEFQLLQNSSLLSIYLGFEINDEELPTDGTGFIVASDSDLLCNACTWTSKKWRHTSVNRKLLVRLFYKSSNPSYDAIKDMNEQELVHTALLDIKRSLGINGDPKVVEVTSWKDLMPNYHLMHGEAVQSIEKKMKTIFPNVFLAGSSFYGVGIGACIKNGKETAEKIARTMVNN